VDATLGGAGHAQAISAVLGAGGCLVGFDLDHDAIERARTALAGAKCRTELVEANFRTMGSALVAREIPRIDKALFDLGWSSYQLGVGRGFSFQADEPLLMTYTKEPTEATLTAATIVNEWEEESIADVLYGWGEERYSRHIARAIAERRIEKPFATSRELAEVIKASVPSRYRFGRIHPATKSFQALRIAVNDELGSLKDGMEAAWAALNPGGRIAVITFHSIEDRIVKQQMVAWEKESGGRRITKKPLPASPAEILSNPRARSAKLRVIEKSVE
jgi:16S rRNA (cytosine1402-N4)-methyltransferase